MLTEKTFIPLSDDLLFKEAFAHKDNREHLINFLKCMTGLDEKIIRSDLEVKYESALEKMRYGEKGMRTDVLITFTNYIVNLECYSYFDFNSLKKSTSYIMKLFSTQLDIGESYDALKKVMQINVVDNVESGLIPRKEGVFHIANDEYPEEKILSDKFEIKYYQIDKIREISYNELSEEMRWIRFIGAQSREERKRVAEGDEALMAFDKWLEDFVNDENTKNYYGEWAEWIAEEKGRKKGHKAGVAEGRKVGHKVGLKEGANQTKIEIAKNLLLKDMAIQEISEITGLSIKEIKKLESK